MLEVRNLHKSFGDLEVLKGIDLSVKAGEVVAIIGPSGSGKSTFLRCLNALEQPHRGEIVIGGDTLFSCKVDGEALSIPKKVKRHLLSKMGMVFQHFHLFPHKTVLENVMEAPLVVKGIKREDARSLALELLTKVGIQDKADVYPSKLSGGQKQRVAIARALGMQPDMMLFDEPTSALDPELVGEVIKVMTQLAREKMTMLVVTHEMGFAREVADRVVFMDEGKILLDLPSAEFFTHSDQPRIKNFIAMVK
jgi:polar amino acid transport system ATP-binding protein